MKKISNILAGIWVFLMLWTPNDDVSDTFFCTWAIIMVTTGAVVLYLQHQQLKKDNE